MNIKERKIEFAKAVEKPLENMLSTNSDNQLQPMSTEKLNLRIDKSEEDFTQNRYKSTAELLTKYQ